MKRVIINWDWDMPLFVWFAAGANKVIETLGQQRNLYQHWGWCLIICIQFLNYSAFGRNEMTNRRFKKLNTYLERVKLDL